MTSILIAVSAAMREAHQDKTRATLAEQATGWVKPLVALAGGIINGRRRGRRRLHHEEPRSNRLRRIRLWPIYRA